MPTPIENIEREFIESFEKKFLEPDFYADENGVSFHARRRFLPFSNPKEVISEIHDLLLRHRQAVLDEVREKAEGMKREGGNPDISGDDGNAETVGYNTALSDLISFLKQ